MLVVALNTKQDRWWMQDWKSETESKRYSVRKKSTAICYRPDLKTCVLTCGQYVVFTGKKSNLSTSQHTCLQVRKSLDLRERDTLTCELVETRLKTKIPGLIRDYSEP